MAAQGKVLSTGYRLRTIHWLLGVQSVLIVLLWRRGAQSLILYYTIGLVVTFAYKALHG